MCPPTYGSAGCGQLHAPLHIACRGCVAPWAVGRGRNVVLAERRLLQILIVFILWGRGDVSGLGVLARTRQAKCGSKGRGTESLDSCKPGA